MKEYNTEEYFKKHGFTDGGYVNKCELKFRKEFFCGFPKEPNFMIKTKFNINDIVCYKEKNFTIIGVIFEAVDEGWEAQYTLQGIEKNEIFYSVPEYKIFAVRSPKYRMGDIIKSFHGKTDYKITEIEVPLQFTTYLYNLISLDGRNCIDQATEEYIEQILEKNAKNRNKFKLGDIVKWTGYKEIDFKITSIIDDGATRCYSLEATSGVCGCARVSERELTLVTEQEIDVNINLKPHYWTGGQVPSCENIVASKNGITEKDLSKAINLYKALKEI